MKIFKFYYLLLIFIINPLNTSGQQKKMVLTFDEVLKLAGEQSPQAIMAHNTFRGSYWAFRSYKASCLPNLNFLSSGPNLSRSYEALTLSGGSTFVHVNEINSNANLALNQNLTLTGGSFYASSSINRIDILGKSGNTSYATVPISFGLNQPINGFNSLKWDKKIEPLKFEEAKKDYLNALEQVSIKAIGMFFDLALAQLNLHIAKTNYSNADTLYKIARGRYNIGTIAENELLQMELSKLNSGTNLNRAEIELAFKKSQLRSFLGYNESIDIEIITPDIIPKVELQVKDVLDLAMKNNPDVLSFQRQLIEANRDVAKARADKNFKANINASYGLTQSAYVLKDAYQKPLDQQAFQMGIQFPILDWGMARGKYKLAQSNLEVTKINVQQAQIDFEQNIFLKVMQFNLQDDQLHIAAKADTVAQLRYNVTKQRFLIGKISVLDLNVALSEKDVALRGYIDALRDYWSFYYEIRRLTLYNFIENKQLTADFDEIVR